MPFFMILLCMEMFEAAAILRLMQCRCCYCYSECVISILVMACDSFFFSFSSFVHRHKHSQLKRVDLVCLSRLLLWSAQIHFVISQNDCNQHDQSIWASKKCAMCIVIWSLAHLLMFSVECIYRIRHTRTIFMYIMCAFSIPRNADQTIETASHFTIVFWVRWDGITFHVICGLFLYT